MKSQTDSDVSTALSPNDHQTGKHIEMNAAYSNWLVFAIGLAIGMGVASALRDQKEESTMVESDIGSSGSPHARRAGEIADPTREQRAKREPNASRPSDAGQITFLPNGYLVVPGVLADRIHIRAMNGEGNVDAEELALIGLSEKDSTKLQGLLNEIKNWELQRETSQAEVVRKNSSETIIRIPSGGRDDRRKQEYDLAIDEIFGRRRPFVEAALSHVGSLTSGWGEADLVATARPTADGFTEYQLIEYDRSRPPLLEEGGDLAAGAISIRSFRAKKVPERLNHLFD